MLIHSGLLFHQLPDIGCICYLFLFLNIFLLDVLFVMPDLVLALFHFKFPLSDIPLTGIRTYLLHQSAVSLRL